MARHSRRHAASVAGAAVDAPAATSARSILGRGGAAGVARRRARDGAAATLRVSDRYSDVQRLFHEQALIPGDRNGHRRFHYANRFGGAEADADTANVSVGGDVQLDKAAHELVVGLGGRIFRLRPARTALGRMDKDDVLEQMNLKLRRLEEGREHRRRWARMYARTRRDGRRRRRKKATRVIPAASLLCRVSDRATAWLPCQGPSSARHPHAVVKPHYARDV